MLKCMSNSLTVNQIYTFNVAIGYPSSKILQVSVKRVDDWSTALFSYSYLTPNRPVGTGTKKKSLVGLIVNYDQNLDKNNNGIISQGLPRIVKQPQTSTASFHAYSGSSIHSGIYHDHQ